MALLSVCVLICVASACDSGHFCCTVTVNGAAPVYPVLSLTDHAHLYTLTHTGKSTLADIYLIGKEEDAVNAASKALTNAAISGTVMYCVGSCSCW
jgi:hypothetical protein